MEQDAIRLWKKEKFLVLDWEVLGRCCARIRDDVEASGFSPTAIVGISRGGLVLAAYLANVFGLRDLQVISIVRNTSEEKYSERGAPRLQWMAPDTSLEGKNVILADDIAGDGGTLRFALALLAARRPAAVRTAVIVKNENARFSPDYHAVDAGDWIVFPWEPPPSASATVEAVRL